MNVSQRVSRYVPLLAALIILAGCNKGPRRADPVDPERARKALRTTLDAWKKGDSFVTLKDGQPSIVAQDMDWQAGRRLVDYQLLDEGKAEDANLICGVRVTLQDRQGKEVKKTVKYIVGTHPYITVFREIMP